MNLQCLDVGFFSLTLLCCTEAGTEKVESWIHLGLGPYHVAEVK